jgi:hypothetical protein
MHHILTTAIWLMVAAVLAAVAMLARDYATVINAPAPPPATVVSGSIPAGTA